MINMSKTFVIGDIHGVYVALKQCLERSNFDYQNDTLIQLGDIVDGYRPDWILCMRELQKIDNLILCRGNHDAWFLEYLNKGVAQTIWVNQGGQTTLEVYKAGLNSEIITEDEVKSFFNKQHFYYLDDENRLFVHGGIKYQDIKDHEEWELMWERDLWQMAYEGYINPASKQYKDFKIQEQKNCIYGVWGKEFGGYRWMPPFGYFYANYVWIKQENEKKEQVVLKPAYDDLEWMLFYMYAECYGFSGFKLDEEFSCDNALIDEYEMSLAIENPTRYQQLLKSDGQYKTYKKTQDYLLELKDKNLGRPLWNNVTKDAIMCFLL